jgi:hypothetical protein
MQVGLLKRAIMKKRIGEFEIIDGNIPPAVPVWRKG